MSRTRRLASRSRDRRLQRRETAEELKVLRDKRSPAEQIALLDAKFGKNLGATKERTRLLRLIENKKAAAPKNKKLKVVEDKKHGVKAKDRRREDKKRKN